MTAAADWNTYLTGRRDDAKAAVLALLARSDAAGGGRGDQDFLNTLAQYRDAKAMVDALAAATA